MTYPFAGYYADDIRTPANTLQPHTTVTVYLHGTLTLATLYTDHTKVTPKANPTATDQYGNLTFYADPGLYDLTTAGGTVTVATTPDAGDLAGALTPSATVTSAGAFGRASAAGVSAAYSRGDHDHGTSSVSPLPLPDTATPGAAPVGGLDLYSHSQNGQSTLRLLTPENAEVDVLRDMMFIARNNTASIIAAGTPVCFTDVFTGGEITPVVSPAQANSLATIAQGVAWEAIPVNGYGRVLAKGRIYNLNTSGYTVNTWLYLSASAPGALTAVKPSPPNTSQVVAFVLRSHATLGELFVTTNNANGNDLGTSANGWQIGDGTAGTKTISFSNGQLQTLQFAPSAARTLVVPDASGTLALAEPAYPADGYGLLGMSADPMWCQNPQPPGTNILWYARVLVPAGKPITNVYFAVRVAGTYDGVNSGNQIGVFSDAGAALGATAVDNTLWTVAGWRGGAVAGGPIAAVAGRRYVYLVALLRGMSVTNFAFPANPNDASAPIVAVGPGQPNRRAAYANGTALPASFDPTTVGTATGYLPLCGFS